MSLYDPYVYVKLEMPYYCGGIKSYAQVQWANIVHVQTSLNHKLLQFAWKRI